MNDLLHEIFMARHAITLGLVAAVVILTVWSIARRVERHTWETDPEKLRGVANGKIQWRDRRIRQQQETIRKQEELITALRGKIDGGMLIIGQAIGVLGGSNGAGQETVGRPKTREDRGGSVTAIRIPTPERREA